MKNNVTVYTTTSCPFCTMLKGFLQQNGIPFKELEHTGTHPNGGVD